MKIGIFGGTFDPIHQGHLSLARSAKIQFSLDKVIFVPAFIPPHKSSKRDLTPAPYRYRMVEMALRDCPEFEISDVEFNRPEISYTVETLRYFKKKFPQAIFYLLMGADSLEEISTWKEPAEIKKLSKLAVARRPGMKNSGAKDVEWIDMPEIPVSSSQLRERLAKGELFPDEVLPASVGEYITKMRLYQKGNE